jgi:hypothetical protein
VDTRRRGDRGDRICGRHETYSNAGRWRALGYDVGRVSIPGDDDGGMRAIGKCRPECELLIRSRNGDTNRTLGMSNPHVNTLGLLRDHGA